MYALIRKISPYTGPDILLGVYTSESDAERGSETYLQRHSNAAASDPWFKQAYRPDGLKASDLQIVPLGTRIRANDGDEVCVVSIYLEMFAQTWRDLDSVHLSDTLGRSRIAEIDRENTSDPRYGLLQKVRIGVLQSDKPEHQPHIKAKAKQGSAKRAVGESGP
jgi:hypothetical protein